MYVPEHFAETNTDEIRRIIPPFGGFCMAQFSSFLFLPA